MATAPRGVARHRLPDPRGAGLPWLLTGLAFVSMLLIGATAGLINEEGSFEYADTPPEVVEFKESARRSKPEGPLPPSPPAETGALGGPPLLADPALLESTERGRLPRVSEDGRTSWRTYRRPPPPVRGPKLALFIQDVGLAAASSEAAAMLPFVVSLATSPYAADGAGWQYWIRAFGHEALLELPLASSRPSIGDGGPDALRPNDSAPQLVDKLQKILARGRGYPAVVVDPAELPPARFRPVAAELARRGVGLIEIGGGKKLADVARDNALPYVNASGSIDADPAPAAIDAALGALEARALSEGQAVGYARPFQVTVERIAAWSRTLPQKGIHLVSPGALFGE